MSDKGFSMESITGSKSTMIVLIGAVIALLGSFLNWATISTEGFSDSATGFSGSDGKITLIVAIATAACAILLKGKARMIAVVIGGAIIAFVGIANVLDVNSFADEFAALGVEVNTSVGIGLWMVLVGGIVAAAGAFIKK